MIKNFIKIPAKSRERPRATRASGKQTCLRRVFSGFALQKLKIRTIGQAERLCIFWYFSLHKKSTEPPQAERCVSFGTFLYIRKVQPPPQAERLYLQRTISSQKIYLRKGKQKP